MSISINELKEEIQGATYDETTDSLELISNKINTVTSMISATTKKTISSLVTQNIFTITGTVKIINIIGVVTTETEASSNIIKLQYTPTGGSAYDMTTGANSTTRPVNTTFAVTGVAAGGFVLGNTTLGISFGTRAHMIAVAGIISFNSEAEKTGVIDWYIEYQPLTTSATITAV